MDKRRDRDGFVDEQSDGWLDKQIDRQIEGWVVG
jgi:hypothetical protein